MNSNDWSVEHRLAALREYAPAIADRIEFVPGAKRETLEEIQCGVFFVMAFWSVYAVRGFRGLSQVLGKLDPGGRLRVVVADIDELVTLPDQPHFADVGGGWGETFWIRDGKIQTQSRSQPNLQFIEESTAYLLDSCYGIAQQKTRDRQDRGSN